MLKTVTVKLDDRVLADIEAEASARGVSRSEVVRDRLDRPRPAGSAPKGSLWDRMKDLVFDDPRVPSDLATNPAHMRGYGKSRTPGHRSPRRKPK